MSEKRNHNRVDTCIHNRSAIHHCPVCDTGERHSERTPLELDAPKAEHAPESWEYEATDVRSPYPFVVKAGNLVIARITDEGDAGVPEARARLMAAAPELEGVLESLPPKTVRVIDGKEYITFDYAEFANWDAWRRLPALAKATGGE